MVSTNIQNKNVSSQSFSADNHFINSSRFIWLINATLARTTTPVKNRRESKENERAPQ